MGLFIYKYEYPCTGGTKEGPAPMGPDRPLTDLLRTRTAQFYKWSHSEWEDKPHCKGEEWRAYCTLQCHL